MPRTTKTTEIATVDMNAEALEQANDALTLQGKAMQKIMSTYNITTTNKDVLVAEIRGHLSSSTELMFGMGVRLMLLKQQCVHGEWLTTLEQIGVASRTAAQLIQATLKFSDPHTGRAREQFIDLDKGKLLELVLLDDEQIEALDKGEMLELDLDEVSRMSTTQLRRKVRELKLSAEAKDKLIERKGKDNDRLQQQLDREFVPGKDSVAQTEQEVAQYLELTNAHTAAYMAYSRLAVIARDIRSADVGDAMLTASETAITHMAQIVAESIHEGGFDVNLEEMITPAWLDVALMQSKAKK